MTPARPSWQIPKESVNDFVEWALGFQTLHVGKQRFAYPRGSSEDAAAWRERRDYVGDVQHLPAMLTWLHARGTLQLQQHASGRAWSVAFQWFDQDRFRAIGILHEGELWGAIAAMVAEVGSCERNAPDATVTR
jgi:hypothetical protein